MQGTAWPVPFFCCVILNARRNNPYSLRIYFAARKKTIKKITKVRVRRNITIRIELVARKQKFGIFLNPFFILELYF